LPGRVGCCFGWGRADRDAALAQLPGDPRRDSFSRGGGNDRASLTDVPRCVLEEECWAVRRRVDDDVAVPERRDRLGEEALDREIVREVGAARRPSCRPRR
jgi:hypothetical protein